MLCGIFNNNPIRTAGIPEVPAGDKQKSPAVFPGLFASSATSCAATDSHSIGVV